MIANGARVGSFKFDQRCDDDIRNVRAASPDALSRDSKNKRILRTKKKFGFFRSKFNGRLISRTALIV